jgi:hypothetical protein
VRRGGGVDEEELGFLVGRRAVLAAARDDGQFVGLGGAVVPPFQPVAYHGRRAGADD